MKVLLHTCCAPCTIFPMRILREEGHDLTGCFYNPNIHPYLEYKKRLETLKIFTSLESLPLIADDSYPMEIFLKRVVADEENRCRHCYEIRLRYAAEKAKAGHFDSFTTTLLYSKYQKHELIKIAGEKIAEEYNLLFLYRDFREGWKEGVEKSRHLGLYRQPYCGCIYSEKERYYRKTGK